MMMTEAPHRFRSVFDLWIVGVGAVIAGDIFGWTPILQAGLGTAALLVLGASTMYAALGMSVAELAVAPAARAGTAAHQLVAPHLGHGFVVACAVGEVTKNVFATAGITASIAAYAAESTGIPDRVQPALWILVVGGIALVAARGQVSHGLQVATTLVSLVVLAALWASAIALGEFGRDKLLTFGTTRLQESVPFALWLFTGIEGLPLAAPNTSEPARLVPGAVVAVVATLASCAFFTLFAATSLVDPDSLLRANSHPLLACFRHSWGTDNPATDAAAFLVVAGLVASHNAFFYYTSQLVSELVADRPTDAVLAAALLASLFAIYLLCDLDLARVADAMIFVAIAGATVAYASQFIAFLQMRRAHRYLDMFHWRSPVGVPGALLGLLLDLFAFVCIILTPIFDPSYRPAAAFVAVIAVAGIIAASSCLPQPLHPTPPADDPAAAYLLPPKQAETTRRRRPDRSPRRLIPFSRLRRAAGSFSRMRA